MPRRFHECGSDVLLLLKSFVASRDLSQPPLIVWPGCKSDEAYEVLCKLSRNEVPCTLLAGLVKTHNILPTHTYSQSLAAVGVSVHLDDLVKQTFLEIADYLNQNYKQYLAQTILIFLFSAALS